MRLIDADALKETIVHEGVRGSGYGDEEREMDVCDMIDEQPTIEPRRGEWIELGMRPAGTKLTHYCSICGGHGSDNMNFCPHCGADMRVEDVK